MMSHIKAAAWLTGMIVTAAVIVAFIIYILGNFDKWGWWAIPAIILTLFVGILGVLSCFGRSVGD